MGRYKVVGFTLVELLVVITIIGILIGLLLPAVQSAREAARAAQCMNNVRQMAMAALHHAEAHGHFPTGGWGWRWAGDPDRGFSHRQPGGWHYNILPYLELDALHQMGAGLTGEAKREAIGRRLQIPVSVFNCPTRRRSIAYPYVHGSPYFNAQRPPMIGRSDYAACSGDMAVPSIWQGPGSLPDGDAMSEEAWDAQPGGGHDEATGVIYRRSEIRIAHIRDGASNTYLLGERYLSPDDYFDGRSSGDDQGWDLGYDLDVNRWTHTDDAYGPRRDTPGFSSSRNFGSAHPAGFHMALCDGSVHRISYAIDPEIHRRLGHRSSGYPIPGDALR